MGAHDPLPYHEYTPEQLSDVYWIDTSHPELGWNKLDSSLNHPRTSAHVVFDGKRLYAMGCCFSDDTRRPYPYDAELKPEVYVVSYGGGDGGGSWHVLKDPPIGSDRAVDVPGRMDGHAVLDLEDDGGKKKRRIVVMHSFGYEQLYSYDVDADSWDVYHHHFQPWTYASAFVDGILYYMDHDHLGVMFGLDLNKPNNQPKRVVLKKNFKENKNRRWIPQDIPGPPPYNMPPPPEPFLVSLGS
ncbi:uncharacterized protein LOC131306517 [Rhododendron vialii]|uniref:uncharacterized protein LOC131306517 n=1 Tax=Rhododendron vialii TaxID=182163 RepID=UPI00265F7B38|nr:uncharacterized protein LOC131306517 [Rhododendron vialii]XP_058188782.1 uncharacterized protein LOC131306517 [Rhododendron vialii]